MLKTIEFVRSTLDASSSVVQQARREIGGAGAVGAEVAGRVPVCREPSSFVRSWVAVHELGSSGDTKLAGVISVSGRPPVPGGELALDGASPRSGQEVVAGDQ